MCLKFWRRATPDVITTSRVWRKGICGVAHRGRWECAFTPTKYAKLGRTPNMKNIRKHAGKCSHKFGAVLGANEEGILAGRARTRGGIRPSLQRRNTPNWEEHYFINRCEQLVDNHPFPLLFIGFLQIFAPTNRHLFHRGCG